MTHHDASLRALHPLLAYLHNSLESVRVCVWGGKLGSERDPDFLAQIPEEA